ncbi:hypothetical protein RRG08_034337 [Elysia crispata]|uniref:Uncharacterized protein n=1 Tax=Elysia crispata TaxID=231223 RepID=A0AAE1B1B4_9GAST|nr:hypothetical protein RRG08_034337 [Elysia crispata]
MISFTTDTVTARSWHLSHVTVTARSWHLSHVTVTAREPINSSRHNNIPVMVNVDQYNTAQPLLCDRASEKGFHHFQPTDTSFHFLGCRRHLQ